MDYRDGIALVKLKNTSGYPDGVLYCYDFRQGVLLRLSSTYRVYSACLSPDLSTVAAITWSPNPRQLVLVPFSGETVKTITEAHALPYSVCWANSTQLVFEIESLQLHESPSILYYDVSQDITSSLQDFQDLKALIGESKLSLTSEDDDILLAYRSALSASDRMKIRRSLALSSAPNLKLPFRSGESWVVTQGYNTGSHINNDAYALDFSQSGCNAWQKPILAVAGGTVTRADGTAANTCGHGGYGLVMEINHGGGYYSLYGHNSSLNVTLNQIVTQGIRVALCGNSGWACGTACEAHPGTHLHFRMTFNGSPYRPEPMSGYSGFVAGGWYTSDNVEAPSNLPNLTPYKPSDWSDKIVVSKTTGTNIDSSPLYTTDTLYIDWAVINNGTGAITNTFYFKLYVDGVERGNFYIAGLNANVYAVTTDYSIGTLSAGTHYIKIVADVTGVVQESDESDNEYTKTITVQATCAYSISPTSRSHGAGIETGSVGVTASSGSCIWTTTSNADWITITSGSSDTGNGTVYYSVSANTGTSPRTGTMTIAGQTFTVNQAGGTEMISTPSTPSGTTNGTVGTSYTYSTGGAISNLGHPVEYRFNWGDGTYSSWSSSATASRTWSSSGTYVVKAQARCATHTNVVSSESSGLSVTIEQAQITVTSFQINNGAAETTRRRVTLNNTATGSPTHYMASESPTFIRGRWKAYTGAPRFKLSASKGVKTVHFKAMNISGKSSVVPDSIILK